MLYLQIQTATKQAERTVFKQANHAADKQANPRLD